jgi:hypothetical protein
MSSSPLEIAGRPHYAKPVAFGDKPAFVLVPPHPYKIYSAQATVFL